MSSTRAIIVDDDAFDNFSQVRNEMKKPHQKSDSAVINFLIEFWRNRSTTLHDEIEEKDIVLSFPSSVLTT